MEKLELKDHLQWFIPTAVSSLIIIFWSKTIWGLFLLISCAYFIFHFWEHLKNYWDLILKYISSKLKIQDTRKILYWIIIFFILILLWIWALVIFWNSQPKIYDLTEDYKIKFQDNFEAWNISNSDDYKWIVKDNKFINWDKDSLTLKSAWLNERGYPIYQNLKHINADHILLSKFYLPEWWRIWLQFANTTSFESNEILDLHYQECRIASFRWNINNKEYFPWYWGYLYKRWGKDDDYEKVDVIPWNYYILAKISWSNISCYIQKEWENFYKTIVSNEPLNFQHLGGPVITKFVDNKNNYPELLEFRLYTK